MIVIASKPGQLANRLFVFAQFIAMAKENNLSIVNPAFDEYAEYFDSTRSGFVARYPLPDGRLEKRFSGSSATRKLFYRLICDFTRIVVRSRIGLPFIRVISLDWKDECRLDEPEFLELAKRTRLIIAQGWLFRASASFPRQGNAIREYFRPIANVQANVDALIRAARADRDVLVGVHIRQGDYRTFQDGRFFFKTEQYTKLMSRVLTYFASKKVRFLICSNVKQTDSEFAAFDVVFGTNHLVEDMYAFAQCDYLVGPPSTYTMWASFYGCKPLWKVNKLDSDIQFDESMFRS